MVDVEPRWLRPLGLLLVDHLEVLVIVQDAALHAAYLTDQVGQEAFDLAVLNQILGFVAGFIHLNVFESSQEIFFWLVL